MLLMNYLNKFHNKGWSKNSILEQMKKENPGLPEIELEHKTNLIYKELNRLNQQSRRLDNNFYKHHILTSTAESQTIGSKQNKTSV